MNTRTDNITFARIYPYLAPIEMKVAILILSHNGKKLLSSYLESVVAHKGDAEIWVIDNGSVDHTIDFIKNILKKSKSRILRFNAFNFFAEYLINFNKYWSAEVPLDFGVGKIKTQNKGFYAFFEPSFIIEYRGFKQFNLGLGTGMRLTVHNRSIYESGLTVQTLIARVNFKFIEMYKYFKQLKNT